MFLKSINRIHKAKLIFFLSLFLPIQLCAQSKKAADAFKDGFESSQKKNYDQAIQYFTEAIRLYDKYDAAYNHRGLAYMRLSRWDEAISDFSKSIELDSRSAAPYINRGNSYNVKKLYDLAITDLSKAINLKPDKSFLVLAYQFRSFAYTEKNKLGDAITDISEAIELDKKNPELYNRRGVIHFSLKSYSSAIKDYTEAIRLDPNLIVAYTNRAVAFLYYGKEIGSDIEIEKGFSDYNEAIRIKPNNAFPFEKRAIGYVFLKKYDLALLDFSEALRLDPNRHSVYNSRASCYKNNGQYELAIRDFEMAIRLNPDEGLYYTNILGPLVRMLQFDKAREYIDQLEKKKLNTNFEDTKFKYYRYYLKVIRDNIPASEYNEALMNLNLAIGEYQTVAENTSESRYTNLLALKGYILDKLNKLDEAKDIYNQALIVNDNQPDVKEALVNIEKKKAVIAQGDKTPPAIELLNPHPSRGFDIVSGKGETMVTGRAVDESGIVSIKVNGKIIEKVEEDGLFFTNLLLKPGPNTISIVATDKKGNTANKTFTVTGAPVANKKETDEPVITGVTPGYYAILIAENNYEDKSIPSLQNPVNDARELKTILESQYIFNPSTIDTLYNRSREDIMQSIVQRCNTMTENDNLIIFYAGHGIAEKDKFGDVDGYWIPVSARRGQTSTYISASDINIALKRSNAKHILVIADACFSGAFTRSLPPDASKGIQKQYKVPSRKVMASGNLEPVPDNSKFIYYLKKTLQENPDKYLSGKKLFDSFYDAILSNTENLPQYAAIKNVGDEGGEFIFIKK